MQEAWIHFKWALGSEPVIFGVHATKESARLDCPVDVLDPDDDGAGPDPDDRWVLEGVSPLGRDENVIEALEGYFGLIEELDDL